MSERIGSTIIENVRPQLDAGRWPIKRVEGESLTVQADVFKEGHDVLVAVVRWRQAAPAGQETEWAEVPMTALGNDLYEASFPLARNGRYEYTVEAWPDLFATWVSELKRKVDAGRDVRSELLEGSAMLGQHSKRAQEAGDAEASRRLGEVAATLGQAVLHKAVAAAMEPGLLPLASRFADRSIATRYDRVLEAIADREKARFSAWYEFFPRSALRDGRTHGTFKDAESWLPYVKELGFDVIYLPPVHPIGLKARKGKNNSLTAAPGDVGSPWAIGGPEGGHKAIHPQLGTLEDFRRFVSQANAQGIEIALDLAYQCSPDHPYVKEHPEWFLHRPDGTIKTAENPPKRYEDIVNFDWLGPGRDTLWPELKSVVMHWVEQGVRIFRVDNPHTKPLPFWAWLIREVNEVRPDVLFLAEAFTRPKVMKALAKLGFQQSYSYFTWRNFKGEMQDYLEELTHPPVSDFMRANFWPNTPDILPEFLQSSGPAGFKLRAVMASTLSSVWGMYCGYEFCEGTPLHPGKEEYLDSEKYELKAWPADKPGHIRDYIGRLNALRREHRALQLYDNLTFCPTNNEQVMCYLKRTPEGDSQVLVAVSFDPFQPQSAEVQLPLEQLGVDAGQTFQVRELLTGQRHLWQGGSTTVVHLSPEQPAVIVDVKTFRRNSEKSFDYYS